MPLRPDLVERLLFLQTQQAPGPLLDLLGGLAFKAVVAAVRLGLFEALHDGPADPDELSRRTGASARGLRFLCDALEPLGYLERDGARYRNSTLAEKWMLASAEAPLSDLFAYFDDMTARWDHLDEAVRVGRPAVDIVAWNGEREGRWRRYHAGMRAIARLLAPEVVARVDVPAGAKRLLDLGGSHGLFAARFCRRYPSLSAVVLDGPAAREVALETIAAEGMEGRVEYRSGDALTDDLGQGWDVALLFNVARALPREPLAALLRRIAGALTDGGRLVILDQLEERPSTPLRRANARLIELELFAASPGDLHRAEDLTLWIAEAGFAPPRRIALKRAGGQQLLVAEKARR